MTAKEIAKEHAKGVRHTIKAALRSPLVSFEARALWLLIESYADRFGNNAHPSMPTLARDSGHNIKWIVRHLKELRDADWISSHTMPGGRCNVYHLHQPQNGVDTIEPIDPKTGLMYLPQNGVRRSTPKRGHHRVTLKGSAHFPSKHASETRTLSPKKKKLPHLPSHSGDEQPTETREERP